MDPAGILLVDLEHLADAAVLPVRRIGAGVFERKAVLDDPLVRRFQVGDELLRTDDEDDVGGAPGVGSERLPEAEAITRVPSRVTAWTLPRAYSAWPATALISGSCVA